ncbi:MAG: hypothetical protein ACREVJ_16545 [Gammaproteobacteria bacterium]
MALEHDQGRIYFRGMDLALERMRSGDANARKDFAYCVRGFGELYQEHGRKEDDELFPTLGDMLTEADDALIVDLMGDIGPADLTLYLTVIAELEAGLA